MYQSYNDKIKALVANLNGGVFAAEGISNYNTVIDRLTLTEYDKIINRDNLFVLLAPIAAFNLYDMTCSDNSHVKLKDNLFTDGKFILIKVDKYSLDSIEKVYDFLADENFFYFFYNGIKVGSKIEIRIAMIKKEKIQPAIKRFEASMRINSKLNIAGDIQLMRNYVNSELFVEDKLSILIDLDETIRNMHLEAIDFDNRKSAFL